MNRQRIRERLRRVSFPTSAARVGVLAVLYATLGVGALSVAVGVTAFVLAHVDVYAAGAVGGAFAFVYSSTVLYAISLAQRTSENERR